MVLNGDGTQTRDFVHVSDVVAHLRAAMDRLHAGAGAGTVLNVCTGQAIAVRALALALFRLQGTAPHIAHGPARPGDIQHSRGQPDAAVAALGVRAAIALDAGLALLDHRQAGA